MTKSARVSCSHGSIPAISLLLFGLAGAAACSGQSDQTASSKHAITSDAGALASDAAASRAHSTEEALSVVRQLGAERPSLAHLSRETAWGLRLHGTKLIPRLVDPEKPFNIDADVPAKYTDRLSVWPIGKKTTSVSLRPLVGGNVDAEETEDGHAIYRDVYGH